jgi:hypothetical protein
MYKLSYLLDELYAAPIFGSPPRAESHGQWENRPRLPILRKHEAREAKKNTGYIVPGDAECGGIRFFCYYTDKTPGHGETSRYYPILRITL